ncbi:MAG: ATP-binding protein [Bacteroidota bacterium]
MADFFKHIDRFFNKIILSPSTGKYEGIIYWQQRLFYYFSITFLFLGIVVLLPSVIISLREGLQIISLVDIVIYLFLLFVFLTRRLTYFQKVILIISALYILSLFLILFLEPYGTGLIWLFSLPIICGVLLNFRFVLSALIINLLILSFFTVGLFWNWFEGYNVQEYNIGVFIAVAINLLVLDIFISVSLAVLLNGLNKTLKRERLAKQKISNQKSSLLKAKNKAEESERLKTAFLANMSHEIRTPMNGILGFAELLKEDGLEPSERKRYLNIITERGENLLQIINDILDLSSIEVNQLKIYEVTFNLNRLMSELYDFFVPRINAKSKNIRFNAYMGIKGPDFFISSDKTRIQQILTNLLSNSLKYTDLGAIDFGYEVMDNNLLFYVKDTGTGIPKEFHSTVFERFRQGEESYKRRYGGTGLGLSISKALVKMLGGDIWFESNEHKGSSFYFKIPLKEPLKINIDKKTNKSINMDWKDKKILVVEDDTYSFELINNFLRKTGITVYHASDGQEALQLFDNNKDFNLVLMDLRLGKTDGLQVTREIRKQDLQVPIIAQTAQAFEEDKNKSLAAGCNDYMTKPIDKEELFSKLKKYM